MEIPPWLRSQLDTPNRSAGPHRSCLRKRLFRGDRFIDATLSHAVSFLQDTLFNERTSSQCGLLQIIEPRIKLVTLIFFIVLLSLQKSATGIAAFLLVAFFLGTASRVPLLALLKRLTPVAVITFVVALPALLNVVVEGRPLLVLFRSVGPVKIGPVVIPQEIAITEQGLKSAATLFFRAVGSVSLVLLITMTTQPGALMKSLSSIVPGPLKPVTSISYRYIFFLLRKVELFVMGLKSRQIAPVDASRGRRWVASRIGLLFSLSMAFSNELAMAMESRGYRGEEFKGQSSRSGVRRLSLPDKAWLIFCTLFAGIVIWKSFF